MCGKADPPESRSDAKRIRGQAGPRKWQSKVEPGLDSVRPRQRLSMAAVVHTKYEFISFCSFSEVLGGAARYVRFLRSVIAARGVRIRPSAYGPDFVKATRLGYRP
jgi:hypothetical protein